MADEEEIPPWDWRRTQQIENNLGQSEQRNTLTRSDLAGARLQIQSLQALLNQVENARQALAAVMATAQGKIQTLETDRNALQARAQMLESDRTAMQGRIQSLETRVDHLENPPPPPAPPPPSPPQGGNP